MDECASHVTLFSTQALSLELAALAINNILILGHIWRQEMEGDFPQHPVRLWNSEYWRIPTPRVQIWDILSKAGALEGKYLLLVLHMLTQWHFSPCLGGGYANKQNENKHWIRYWLVEFILFHLPLEKVSFIYIYI